VGNVEAEGLGGVQVEHELEPGRLLDRQVGRLCTLEDFPGVDTGPAIRVADTRPVAHQAAGVDKLAREIDRRNRVARRERDELLAATEKKGIGAEREHADPLLTKAREGRINLGWGARIQDMDFYSE